MALLSSQLKYITEKINFDNPLKFCLVSLITPADLMTNVSISLLTQYKTVNKNIILYVNSVTVYVSSPTAVLYIF